MPATMPFELDRSEGLRREDRRDPAYYRKNVDLVAPKVGNFVGNPTQAGPSWNAIDW